MGMGCGDWLAVNVSVSRWDRTEILVFVNDISENHIALGSGQSTTRLVRRGERRRRGLCGGK